MAKRRKKSKKARGGATGRTPRRRCGAMGMHHHLLEMNSGFRKRQVTLEQRTARMMDLTMDELMPSKPRVIPVVVHVLFNTRSQNISDRQITSQMTVLNRDFRLTNPDRSKIPAPFKCRAADAMIEFKLATRDPRGRRTNGITRTQTSKRSFAAGSGCRPTC